MFATRSHEEHASFDGATCRAAVAGDPQSRPSPCSMCECPLVGRLGKTRTFEAGEIVFWEGDRADRYFLIVSGVLRGCRLLSDGRRQINRFVFAGDLMAHSSTANYPYTAEAVTPVTLISLPRAALSDQAEEAACLRRLVVQSILSELHATQDQVLVLGRMTATERVLHFLMSLANRTGAEGAEAIELPMSRADIADFLGLTIETVSRVLSRFKREGKITMLGHNRIVFKDPKTLAPPSEELAA